MKPKVCGHPARILDPFHLAKTILFSILIIGNNSIADDFMNEIFSAFDAFNQNGIVKIEYTRQKPETGEEARARWANEEQDRKDVAINKELTRGGWYYVDGKWVLAMQATPENAKCTQELKDSDNDGYDDYTEFTHGTNWKDRESIPSIRDGNNKKTFK